MLPEKIDLGCGHVILVVQVSPLIIQAAIGAGTDAAWSVDVPDDSPYAGVIFIDESLPEKRKRVLLYHELVHATNDISLWERDANV